MALVIVLIVFTLVLATMSLGVYLWWRKYGKKLFSMFENVSKMQNPDLKNQKLPNLNDLRDQMKAFQQFFNKKG